MTTLIKFSKKKKSRPTNPSTSEKPFDRHLELIWDFIYSIVWNQRGARAIFKIETRKISHFRTVRHVQSETPDFQRNWILKQTWEVLSKNYDSHQKKLSASEQVMLDSLFEPELRLKNFESYFHRLNLKEKAVLLFRDKYGFSTSEVASILSISEGSLKLLRQEALSSVEQWIWPSLVDKFALSSPDRSSAANAVFSLNISPVEQQPPSFNCSQLENSICDLIDGTLRPVVRENALKHLDNCPACQKYFKHLQSIMTALKNIKRHPLPVHLAQTKRPENSSQLLKLQLRRISESGRFKLLTRTVIEGTTLCAVIIAGFAILPKIPSLFVKKSSSEVWNYELKDLLSPNQNSPSKDKQAAIQSAAIINPTGGMNLIDDHESVDEFEEDAVDEAESEDISKIIAKSGEIWRFNFKSHTPSELKTRVITRIEKLSNHLNQKDFKISEVPGGIQIDLIAPTKVTQDIFNDLTRDGADQLLRASADQKTTKLTAGILTSSEGSEFTWYRNKSKKPIPQGSARIVFWLSQI